MGVLDAVVVGAGLSGCVAAKCLAREHHVTDVVVLERLARLGGRTFAPDGVDLGAAWSWPSHDRGVQRLVMELGLGKVPQDVRGAALFEGPGGEVAVFGQNESPAGPGAVRIEGGSAMLCSELAAQNKLQVRLGAAVAEIRTDGDIAEVVTASGETLQARTVIVAMPPKMAASIAFDPPLAEDRLAAMVNTPTWMGDAGKVCLQFFGEGPGAFWRDKRGSNGTFMSRTGPVKQGWDNSAPGKPALCGFVFGNDLALLEDLQRQADARGGSGSVASPILDQFERIFGPDVRSFSKIQTQTWRDFDTFTPPTSLASGAADKCTASGRDTAFGDARLSAPHARNIFFAGTESTPHENGHMEGAVLAGQRVAREVKACLAA